MGVMKWRGKAALARTTGPTATATPNIFPIGEADQVGEPILIERTNNITPDVLGAVPAGFNYKFSASKLQVDLPTLGKLLWLFFGQETAVTDTHTIIGANTQQYFEHFCDRGLDLGTATPTETLLGCKMDSLELEILSAQFATASYSGLACNRGAAVAALSPTAQVDANHAPLSWASIMAATSPFKVGYAGAALAADLAITGIKFNFKRGLKENPVDLSGLQPSGIQEGGRTIEYEITREFSGAGALLMYNAWAAQALVGIELNALAGTNTAKIEIPQAVITGSFSEGVGPGEDIMMGTLKCKATQPAAAAIFTATIKDGVSGAYT